MEKNVDKNVIKNYIINKNDFNYYFKNNNIINKEEFWIYKNTKK